MILEKIKNIETRWIILFSGILGFFILAIIDFEIFKNASSFFWETLLRIIPILIIVFLMLFASNLFISTRWIAKYLGEDSRFKGWLIAVIGGIISSGPIYMWYPLLSDLKEKGTRNSFLVAFLYNRAVKIPLLPLMIFYFNWPFVLILTFYMIIFSIINGIVVDNILENKKEVFKV